MRIIQLLFLLTLLACGCGSSLIGRANSPHQIKAHWNLKDGFKPFDLTVFENKESFRVITKTKTKSHQYGPYDEEVKYNLLYVGGSTLYKINPDGAAYSCELDKADLARLRFWRVPDVNYKEAGKEKVGKFDCIKFTASGTGFGGIVLDQALWISPEHGYLCKNSTTSGGENFGVQMECDEIEEHPTYTAGMFDPPANAQKLSELIRTW